MLRGIARARWAALAALLTLLGGSVAAQSAFAQTATPQAGAASAPAAAGVATITDTALDDGPSNALVFYIDEIDGVETKEHGLRATERAGRGRGAYVQPVDFSRTLPSGKRVLRMRAYVLAAMPIQYLFGRERPDLQGRVEVDLQAGGRYRVTGVLDSFRREVWLEDEATKAIVGSKVVLQATEAEMAAMAGASYTCCNLHYDGDWISDANWATAPMIPAGARIKVIEWRSDRAQVLIEGRKFRIGQDYGRKLETIQALVAKLIVAEDPRPRLAMAEAPVRQAVQAGKLRMGMSKEQVIWSMGPPRVDSTRSLDLTDWIYYTLDELPLKVRFDSDGRVAGFEGADKVRAQLVLSD